ncbi:transcription antitermination factor NusB [Clostridium cellulovorans]|uniref:Transcription antitermination protein NusB n=1 Tax=Clostridium cellulovorans (strain ATCC 35296 / DSM 3052 / OCM 3 / 743B) TaxID=573061 RepID=D9SLU5_CLOC7|nr:transcription antitermination factor NusB [Clostridium cellulovorans]ADL51676.1 NusB antitermination factor [Clostridium cellulovorans 743B]
MNRRKTREIAIKLTYSLMIQQIDYKTVIENFKEVEDKEDEDLKDVDFTFVETILSGISENKSNYEELVSQNLIGWKLNRISKLNLAILLVAIYEIKNIDDIPKAVSINEAVEIAKKYSDDKAPNFINSILDKID